jgi:NADH dehydrogenase FAD-containing subunit
MSEQRNIVILGASFAGINATHYILKYIIPALKAKKEATYHVYLVNPSSDFYYRSASSRFAASTDRLPADKILHDIQDIFKVYSSKDFTFIQGTATGLDTTARKVFYKRPGSNTDDSLPYHALVIATGSRTGDPVFSMHSDTPALLALIKQRNSEIKSAHDIIVSGGGPTGVEHAAEIGELLNGKPGWFSWLFGAPVRKVNITLITASNHLLPITRPSIGKSAEARLKRLGVDVVYNTRVAQSSKTENGKTQCTLTSSNTPERTQEVDLYIPAHGVLPNSSWLPKRLLDAHGWLQTNPQTLRVDAAGPRIYAIGDIASFSRRTIPEILQDSIPVLAINMKRDLLSYSASSSSSNPDSKPRGKDRLLKQQTHPIQIVPIGSAGGVGEAFGWRFPSLLIWAVKARDMMVFMAPPTFNGGRIREVGFRGEEGAF